MTLHLSLLQHKSAFVIEELNKQESDVNLTNPQGLTLLQVAAREGLHEVVLTLLFYGADINQADNGTKPALLLAFEHEDFLVIHILLACGASQQLEALENLELDPAVIRGLLFWMILKSDSTQLLSLIQPQIEKNSSHLIHQYLQRELSSLIKLCMELHRTILATKLMEIAANIHAHYYNADTVISIYTAENAFLTFEEAFNNKDYITLHKLLKLPVDKHQLLVNAVKNGHHELEFFISVSISIDFYDLALRSLKNGPFFSEYFCRQGVAKSILHQVVSQHIPINTMMSRDALHLFQQLPHDLETKQLTILESTYNHHPYPTIGSLLSREETIIERVRNANFHPMIMSLVREKFLRFGYDATPRHALSSAGDKKLPNDVWKVMFSYLTRNEQKRAHTVSRHFRQLIKDPICQTALKLNAIQQKLLAINNFLEAEKNEREARNGCFGRFKDQKVPLAITTSIGILVGVFSYLIYHYQQIIFSLHNKLPGIPVNAGVNNSTCDDYYDKDEFYCLKQPEVCDDLCDEIHQNNSGLAGVGVATGITSGIFLLAFMITLDSLCNSGRHLNYLSYYSEDTQDFARIMLRKINMYPLDNNYVTFHSPVVTIIRVVKQIKVGLEEEWQALSAKEAAAESSAANAELPLRPATPLDEEHKEGAQGPAF